MCKHPMVTPVNWHPVLERDAVDNQCDICGAFARNVELGIDFDAEGRPIEFDVNSFPVVDVVAFEAWQRRTG